MSVVERKAIRDLDKKCSLDLRDRDLRKRGGFAASDQCNARATTAVLDDNDNYLPRCSVHQGIIKLVRGPSYETIPVKVQS